MESTSECGLFQSGQELTDKQRKLIDECTSVISKEGIRLEINPILNPACSPFSVDVEHDEQGNMVGIGVCLDKWCGYFTDITKYLREVLETGSLVMHNGVSDIECLRMWGINVSDEQLVHDTMLVGHLLDSSLKSYGLKDMARRELGIEYPSYDGIVGKRGLKAPRITLDKQPIELVSKYNALDTYVTYKLYERQKKAMGI